MEQGLEIERFKKNELWLNPIQQLIISSKLPFGYSLQCPQYQSRLRKKQKPLQHDVKQNFKQLYHKDEEKSYHKSTSEEEIESFSAPRKSTTRQIKQIETKNQLPSLPIAKGKGYNIKDLKNDPDNLTNGKCSPLESLEQKILNYFKSSSIKDEIQNCNFQAIEKIINKLKALSIIDPFLTPVNTNEYDCKDYYEIIKHPISLQEISQKHENKQYLKVIQLMNDINLMLNNSFYYNPLGSDMWGITKDVCSACKKIIEGIGGNGGVFETLSRKVSELINERKEEIANAKDDLTKILKTHQIKKRLLIQYNLSKLNSDELRNVWEIIAGDAPKDDSQSMKLECNLSFLETKKLNELEKLLKKSEEFEEFTPAEIRINQFLQEKIEEIDLFSTEIKNEIENLKLFKIADPDSESPKNSISE